MVISVAVPMNIAEQSTVEMHAIGLVSSLRAEGYPSHRCASVNNVALYSLNKHQRTCSGSAENVDFCLASVL